LKLYQFTQIISWSALIAPDQQPYTFLVSFIIWGLLFSFVGWYSKRRHWGRIKLIIILDFLILPLFLIVGLITQAWLPAIGLGLIITILYPALSLFILNLGQKMRPRIRENILKKIDENMSHGIKPIEMQKMGLLPKNKTLLGYGFTEEKLKELGLLG
jgi:hypothetical protein